MQHTNTSQMYSMILNCCAVVTLLLSYLSCTWWYFAVFFPNVNGVVELQKVVHMIFAIYSIVYSRSCSVQDCGEFGSMKSIKVA